MAKEVGGDPDFAVAAISISTMFSSVTYGLWLAMAQTIYPPKTILEVKAQCLIHTIYGVKDNYRWNLKLSYQILAALRAANAVSDCLFWSIWLIFFWFLKKYQPVEEKTTKCSMG
ncbi:MAG: hypothetical protein KAI40_09795 [Desulfobacterales bacterium]|nr:hypothetical protein [Desulfobacterales bacterium]